MNENAVVLLAIQYAISFFVFGWIFRGWNEEDKGRERFWLVKHYWRKLRKANDD